MNLSQPGFIGAPCVYIDSTVSALSTSVTISSYNISCLVKLCPTIAPYVCILLTNVVSNVINVMNGYTIAVQNYQVTC